MAPPFPPQALQRRPAQTIRDSSSSYKHCENREKLHREHLIGCGGVKLSLLKDVNITTVTTTTIASVTITTVTIEIFVLKKKLSQKFNHKILVTKA